jgi:hypothetical protein
MFDDTNERCYQKRVMIGADGSMIMDGDLIYIMDPQGLRLREDRIKQVDYIHGCTPDHYNGRLVQRLQTADDEEEELTNEEVIVITPRLNGIINYRIRCVQRLWREIHNRL